MKKTILVITLLLSTVIQAFAKDVFVSFEKSHYTQESLDKYPEYLFRYTTFVRLEELLQPKDIRLVNCDKITYPYFTFDEENCEYRHELLNKTKASLNFLENKECIKQINPDKDTIIRKAHNTAVILAGFITGLSTDQTPLHESPRQIDPENVVVSSELAYSIAGFDDFSFALLSNPTGKVELFSPFGEKISSTQYTQKNDTDGWALSPNAILWSNSKDTIKLITQKAEATFRKRENSLELSRTKKYSDWPDDYVSMYFSRTGNPYLTQEDDYLLPTESLEPLKKIKRPYYSYANLLDDSIFYCESSNFIFSVDFDDNILESWYVSAGKVQSLKKILPDSKMIISFYDNKLVCLNPDNTIDWSMNYKPSYNCEEIYSGILYIMADSHRILRYALPGTKLPEDLGKISESTGRLNENKYANSNEYLEMADLYEKNGGTSAAQNCINHYLEKSPNNPAAVEKLLQLELVNARKTTRSTSEAIAKKYEDKGRYTAQADFFEFAPTLEEYLKKFPGDEELHKCYSMLISLFDPSNKTEDFRKDLEIKSVDFVSLFPALRNYYSKKPCGNIVLKNISSSTISRITITSSLLKYMDFESETREYECKSGEEISIPVNLILNSNILDITENTQAQIKFTVKYFCGSTERKLSFVRPVTLYNKNAISWTNTAMLSCFIQPNDPTVSKFTFKALETDFQNRKFISRNFTQAVKIINAIGSIPLNYVKDPDMNFSEAVENKYAIDTVRFPSSTLRIKGGDCDDMTALLCSALESAGIPTMLITLPGHIMTAFKADSKYNEYWKNFSSNLKTLNVNGETWIPVETTVMHKGFLESWKTASSQIADESMIEEMILVSEQRELFPPIASEEDPQIIPFKEENARSLCSTNIADISNEISGYLAKKSLEKNSSQQLNIIARMYHITGDNEKAISILRSATKSDPKNKAIKNNLDMLTKKSPAIHVATQENGSSRASDSDEDFNWEEN